MPELPEVETMVRGVRPTLTGRQILDVQFCRCSRKPISVKPSKQRFRQETIGTVISAVTRLAKRIVIHLKRSGHQTDGPSVPDLTAESLFIVIEPRMTGLLLLENPPSREHRRICWQIVGKDGTAASFEFWDRRGLGTVTLLTESEFDALSRTLGKDATDFTTADWIRTFSRSNRAIKVAMLDQTRIGGIGNLYASEILHRAGIGPQRACCSLSRDDWKRIARCTKAILATAIRYEGSTLSDGTYRNALSREGRYQNEHRVYGKEGTLCPRCRSATIQRIVQGQRSTFLCPACQPEN
ncbi:MAG: formamidopyrimidine-DNA glycosylase [Planctomycetaceae bacterium]|nr:formamidopyrimidine-DNA glycosylase [Planctomycetaceae bacterium]